MSCYPDIGDLFAFCTACGTCVEACPTEAITLNDEYCTLSFDIDSCICCEVCEDLCPVEAIHMEEV